MNEVPRLKDRDFCLEKKEEPTVLPIETEKVSETPSSRRKD